MFFVIQDSLLEERLESIFTIKLGSLVYSIMINAYVIAHDMLNFNFGFYQGRRDFDSKKFARLVLDIKDQLEPVPQHEDLWEYCN